MTLTRTRLARCRWCWRCWERWARAARARHPPPPPATTSAPSATSSPAVVTQESADDPVNQVLAISIDGLNPRAIQTARAERRPGLPPADARGRLDAQRAHRAGVHPNPAEPHRDADRPPGRRDPAWSRRGFQHRQRQDRARGRRALRGQRVRCRPRRGRHDRDVRVQGEVPLLQPHLEHLWRRRPTGADNGRAKIDRVTIDKNNARLVSKLNAELRTKPRQFTFLHISLPDDAGHSQRLHGSGVPDRGTANRHVARIDPLHHRRTSRPETADARRVDGRPRWRRRLARRGRRRCRTCACRSWSGVRGWPPAAA